MWEACVVDVASGQTLTGSLMDYALPRGGEGGTTPAPAVIASAIADALRPFGVTQIPLPASPATIWSAIRNRRGTA